VNDAKSFNWEDAINMKESQNIEWKESWWLDNITIEGETSFKTF